MSKLYQPGDRSRAVCEHCESVVETRFEYRTYALSVPRVDVPGVLVAACVECGGVAAVPYQSSERLNKARRAAADTAV